MPLPTGADVHAALDAGLGLPPALYVDPDGFEVERATLWSSAWMPAARWDDLTEPGSFVTVDVAGDPVVVVRGNDGVVRAFANVCRHRSATIMSGCGTARVLQCPYHRWTWALDGTLRVAPDMGASFDRTTYGLLPLAVEEWNGWVLVNLDADAPSFAASVPGLTERLASFELTGLVRGPSVSYESAFNWKIQVENFAESYHHAGVHGATLQPTYPGQRSWLEPNGGEPWLWVDHVATAPETPTFTANVVFPSFMFSVLRGAGALWFSLQPHAVDRNTLDVVVLVPPDASADTRQWLLDGAREITDEDVVINERTHAGLQSRFARPGPAGPLEAGLQDFRRWLAGRLGPALPER